MDGGDGVFVVVDFDVLLELSVLVPVLDLDQVLEMRRGGLAG